MKMVFKVAMFPIVLGSFVVLNAMEEKDTTQKFSTKIADTCKKRLSGEDFYSCPRSKSDVPVPVKIGIKSKPGVASKCYARPSCIPQRASSPCSNHTVEGDFASFAAIETGDCGVQECGDSKKPVIAERPICSLSQQEDREYTMAESQLHARLAVLHGDKDSFDRQEQLDEIIAIAESYKDKAWLFGGIIERFQLIIDQAAALKHSDVI